MAGEIDHEYTRVIVCPYCGWKSRDSFEDSNFNNESGTELDCPECGNEFEISVHVSVSYSTERKGEDRRENHQQPEPEESEEEDDGED